MPSPNDVALEGVAESGSPILTSNGSSLWCLVGATGEVGVLLRLRFNVNEGLKRGESFDMAGADLSSSEDSRARSGWSRSVNKLGALRCWCFFSVFGGCFVETSSFAEVKELRVGMAKRLLLLPQEESLLLRDIVWPVLLAACCYCFAVIHYCSLFVRPSTQYAPIPKLPACCLKTSGIDQLPAEGDEGPMGARLYHPPLKSMARPDARSLRPRCSRRPHRETKKSVK